MHDNLATGFRDDRSGLGVHHRHTLLQGEQRRFVPVDRDADHQTVHQRHSAPDDIDMAKRHRVERAGVKTDAHEGPRKFVVVRQRKRFTFNLNQSEGKPRHSRHRVWCVSR